MYSDTLEKTLKDKIGIERLTVTYHHPKNLHDLLIPSTLFEAKGAEVLKHWDRLKGEE